MRRMKASSSRSAMLPSTVFCRAILLQLVLGGICSGSLGQLRLKGRAAERVAVLDRDLAAALDLATQDDLLGAEQVGPSHEVLQFSIADAAQHRLLQLSSCRAS